MCYFSRGFFSKIDISNTSFKSLRFKEINLRQVYSLDIHKSIYKLLGSFIVQICKVIKSQKERFLVCFRLILRGCGRNSSDPC
jgi:hypothetical protein